MRNEDEDWGWKNEDALGKEDEECGRGIIGKRNKDEA